MSLDQMRDANVMNFLENCDFSQFQNKMVQIIRLFKEP